MRGPGWMLDRGWALTAEISGVTTRDRLGPHRAPSIAWARARGDEALLMIGGRHLGAQPDPPTRLTITADGAPLAAFDTQPGSFFRLITVPAGALRGGGDPYVAIAVTSGAADDEGGREVPVALEQFDLQSAGVAMLGFRDGWHEPEFNRELGRPWRWMSDRAVVWVRPTGRDVTLTVAGESPLRYFDRPSVVRVSIGGRDVARFSASRDFSESVLLPAASLHDAQGQVEIRADQFFVPAERDGGPDRRQLALRLYDLRVQ